MQNVPALHKTYLGRDTRLLLSGECDKTNAAIRNQQLLTLAQLAAAAQLVTEKTGIPVTGNVPDYAKLHGVGRYLLKDDNRHLHLVVRDMKHEWHVQLSNTEVHINPATASRAA